MSIGFTLRQNGSTFELVDLGNRVVLKGSKGEQLSFGFAAFKASAVGYGEGVLKIGRNKFEYEQKPEVEAQLDAFCSRFGHPQVGSSDSSASSEGQASAKFQAEGSIVRSERTKGLAIAKTVREMTTFLIALTLVGCVALGWVGKPREEAIGFAIGLGVVVVFQGLLILMLAQYIVARLSDD